MTEENNAMKLEHDNSTAPAEMIRLAIEKGDVDMDKLEKLLELQQTWETNQAKKSYTIAFSEVQKNVTAVVKTQKNTQTNSTYARLEDVIDNVKPIYTEQGFSVIFYESDSPNQEQMRICADVLHSSGHKETYHYDIPLDGIGIKGNANMTKIHAKASSVSYGRRYLMCMIWNIPTTDNDAQGIGVEFITPEQVTEIEGELKKIDTHIDAFLGFLDVDALEKIPSTKFTQAMSVITARKEKLNNVT